MALTQPALIPQPWGSDGQVGNIPQDSSEFGKASWAKGFPTETAQPLTEGGIPPSYLDFQGVLNALSAHAVFMQSGAHYAWSNTLDYPAGCFVLGSDGKLYQALQASGPGYSAGAKNPTTSAAYWQVANFAEYLKTSGGTMTGEIDFNRKTARNVASVELMPSAGFEIGGYIDFHFGGNEADDYTTRIIEQVEKRLDIWAQNGLTVNGHPVLSTADSATIAGYAMPSARYQTIQLGSSGASYTAPANGFFCMNAQASSNGASIRISNNNYFVTGAFSTSASLPIRTFLPVRKGDTVTVSYDNLAQVYFFNFVYAAGDN